MLEHLKWNLWHRKIDRALEILDEQQMRWTPAGAHFANPNRLFEIGLARPAISLRKIFLTSAKLID
jgi:hypothetical protein